MQVISVCDFILLLLLLLLHEDPEVLDLDQTAPLWLLLELAAYLL